MSIRQLSHGIVKLINSTQVINSVESVIKELVENSIDAGATVIDIKLEKYGLDKIEIRDNGAGINTSDIHSVCKPNHTSKILSLKDLETLNSYGFRGEALNSICAVSRVNITTRTETDEIALVYTFDSNGTIRETKRSHQMRGSTITITNLFKNVPVRRQYFDNLRKANEELKKIERTVKILSVIHPKLRITISHNKCLIWHKTAVSTLKESLMQMYQHVVPKNLEYFCHSVDHLSIEMLICKKDSNWLVLLQPQNEAILLFINQRPIKDKKVEKVIIEEMNYLFQSALPCNKCPLTLISLKLPPRELDVNLEPDKTKVFIRNHEYILKQIRECVTLHFYKQPLNEVDSNDEQANTLSEDNPPKRFKFNSVNRVIAFGEEKSGNTSVSCSRDASVEKSLSNNLQISSVSMTRNENLKVELSTTNALDNEFEDRDLFAHPPSSPVENTTLSVNDNSELRPSTSYTSVQQPTIVNISVINSTLKSTTQQCKDQASEPFFMLNAAVQKSNINSVSFEIMEENVNCVKNECNDQISMNQDSASIYNPFKYTNNCKSNSAANTENRLSISGNLVDTLFQSQFSDDEEIHLRSSDDMISNGSTIVNYAPGSIHERLEDSYTSNAMDDNSSTNGGIMPQQDELCTHLNSSRIVPSNDGSSSVTSTTSLTQTTLSQWSKGHVAVNNQQLKGPSALLPNKNSPAKKQVNKEFSGPLERSVSSQMGRKDLAGLTNFARSARMELIGNNPDLSFTKVASELAKRWRGLDELQKEEYAEKARMKKISKATSTHDERQSKSHTKKPKIYCSSSVDAIRTRLLRFKNKNEISQVRIIAALEPGKLYLCRIDRSIALIDVRILQRSVLLHRYLFYSSLSSRCLDEPLELTEELIGNQCWALLLSMDRLSNDNDTFNIIDPRISKNGFKIVFADSLKKVDKLTRVEHEQLIAGDPPKKRNKYISGFGEGFT